MKTADFATPAFRSVPSAINKIPGYEKAITSVMARRPTDTLYVNVTEGLPEIKHM